MEKKDNHPKDELESLNVDSESISIDMKSPDPNSESSDLNLKPVNADFDLESLCSYIDSLHLDNVDNAHINVMARCVEEGVKRVYTSNCEEHFNFEDRKTFSEAIDRYVRIIELIKKEKMPKYAIWNTGNSLNIIIVSAHIEEKMYELFDEWNMVCKQTKIDTDIIRGTLNRLDDVNRMMQFFNCGGSRLAEIFGFPWAVNYNKITTEYVEIKEYVHNCFLMSSIICPNMEEAIAFKASRMDYFNKVGFWKDAGVNIKIKEFTDMKVIKMKKHYMAMKSRKQTMD